MATSQARLRVKWRCYANYNGAFRKRGRVVRIRRLLLAILHQLLCPYILVALTSFLTFCVVAIFHGTAATARMLLFATPFYPIQIGTALVAGCLVTRYFKLPKPIWTSCLPSHRC